MLAEFVLPSGFTVRVWERGTHTRAGGRWQSVDYDISRGRKVIDISYCDDPAEMWEVVALAVDAASRTCGCKLVPVLGKINAIG
jgi:hypothetical protein